MIQMMDRLEQLQGVEVKYSFNFVVAEGNNWAVKVLLREYGYTEGYDYDEVSNNEVVIYL